MNRNARTAFNRLKAQDVPVYDHLSIKDRHGAHFIIGAELRNDRDRYYADHYGHEVREFEDDSGKIVNQFNVREDVWKVLRPLGLTIEWINAAQVGVYDA